MLQKYFYALLLFLFSSSMAFAVPTTLTPIQQKVLSGPLQQPYVWFASTDSKAQNNDYLVLGPGEKHVIPLTAGALLRFWCTALEPDKVSVTLENTKEIPLLADNKALAGTFHEKAYTLYPQSTKNVNLQVLDKTASIVVVNHSDKPNKFFYQVSVRPLPIVTAPLYSGEKVLISSLKQLDIGENMSVGNEGQLKSGIINRITISSPDSTPLQLPNFVMKITPNKGDAIVRVPLSAFVGGFQHTPQGSTGLSRWDGKVLIIDWPMPIGADDVLSLTIENTGKTSSTVKVEVSLLQMEKPPAFLFCAQAGSGNSVENQPFTLAMVDGSGALVGVSADMGPQPDSPRRTFAFLEGNETIATDNKNFEGTGTEDFFNSAWYFPQKPYLHPNDAVTAHSVMPPRVAASRWMIDDAMPFKNQLNINLEHGSGNRGKDLQYHWHVFWYQQHPVRFDVPKILHQADLDMSKVPVTAPGNSLVAGLLRVVIFTVLFAGMILIVLMALAKYGQRKE